MIPRRPLTRPNMSSIRWLLTFILLIVGVSVQNSDAAGPLNVYVVNYPLKYFAERIGGDHVRVKFPVPADVDPANWNPDLADIAAYQQADLILLNGAGYAKWVPTSACRDQKLWTPPASLKTAIFIQKKSQPTAMVPQASMPMRPLRLPPGLIWSLPLGRLKRLPSR